MRRRLGGEGKVNLRKGKVKGRNLRSGEEDQSGEKEDEAAEGRELMKAEGPDGEGAHDCHLVQDDRDYGDGDDDDGDGDGDGDVRDCDFAH